jgi:endonuclease/exonuclease/phosphatase (EEP) superfamily protein YafD
VDDQTFLPATLRIISWNLLHAAGASADDVAGLITRHRPDLVLMQEVTRAIDGITERIGGCYARTPLPGRIHGLAIWSRLPLAQPPVIHALPAGTIVERISQTVRLGAVAVTNVHLSHGQLLNRRQLRSIVLGLPRCAAVLGDFNLLGPPLLPGFRDVGPRRPTHRMADLVPLRLDRCVVRGMACLEAEMLPRLHSDHHPIMVRLAAQQALPAPIDRPGPRSIRRHFLATSHR